MANPMDKLTSYNFYHYSCFWPDQFPEICKNLILIPDVVICERKRCSARKELALFFYFGDGVRLILGTMLRVYYIAVIVGVLKYTENLFIVKKTL
jgi:hypothetical protein